MIVGQWSWQPWGRWWWWWWLWLGPVEEMLEAVKQAVVSLAARLGNIVHTYVHHQHCQYHHPIYQAGTQFALIQSKCFVNCQSITIFLCIGPFLAWWQTNERTNEQPGDPRARLLLTNVRRQSFAINIQPRVTLFFLFYLPWTFDLRWTSQVWSIHQQHIQ